MVSDALIDSLWVLYNSKGLNQCTWLKNHKVMKMNECRLRFYYIYYTEVKKKCCIVKTKKYNIYLYSSDSRLIIYRQSWRHVGEIRDLGLGPGLLGSVSFFFLWGLHLFNLCWHWEKIISVKHFFFDEIIVNDWALLAVSLTV